MTHALTIRSFVFSSAQDGKTLVCKGPMANRIAPAFQLRKVVWYLYSGSGVTRESGNLFLKAYSDPCPPWQLEGINLQIKLRWQSEKQRFFCLFVLFFLL